MFAFRCKCHLCSGWFEIRTDPKNTRYVVESGARQKMEDWNPEENGGYAIHDSSKAEQPVDPLASLEKTAAAQEIATTVTAPRIDELYELSDKYNADPYEHSRRIRKYFRKEKKIDNAKRAADDLIKDRYSLPQDLKLVEDKEIDEDAKTQWHEAKLTAVAQPSQSFATARRSTAPSRTNGKPLNTARQASTLSAILLRNTSRSSMKKKPPDIQSIGIIRR